jgi:hypothetical protein
MKIGKWKLFFAIPRIQMQLMSYPMVKKELEAIDGDKLRTLAPVSAAWLEEWQAIVKSVQK